jgi:hypothetical protein
MRSQLSRSVAMKGLHASALVLAGMWLFGSSPALGQERGVSAVRETPAGGDSGIAARYLGDVGIEKDPDVIFADDFESWGS